MKIYCTDTKGLIHNELTKGKGYHFERRQGDLYYMVNDEGHKAWYKVDRFVECIPNKEDCDDTDVKILGKE